MQVYDFMKHLFCRIHFFIKFEYSRSLKNKLQKSFPQSYPQTPPASTDHTTSWVWRQGIAHNDSHYDRHTVQSAVQSWLPRQGCYTICESTGLGYDVPMSPWLYRHLPEVWQSRGRIAKLLTPVSLLYAALVSLQKGLYRAGLLHSTRLPVPVLVVGNVVSGGAGKTPVTMAIVQHLLAQGWSPGVVSRGHGRQKQDTRAVFADSRPSEVGDEPLLIRQKTGVPVWVSPKRADAGHALLHAHPETTILICDDGLQHWALARDLDICVMDDRGIGNGWLLPAGPLREAWPRKVDLLLHTGRNEVGGGFQAYRHLGSWATDSHGQKVALDSLLDQPVDALAGLARPAGFFKLLREKGLSLHLTTPLPDHFDFATWSNAPLQRPLLCTEKDAAKLWQHQPLALAVPLELTPEPAFWSALDRLVGALDKR